MSGEYRQTNFEANYGKNPDLVNGRRGRFASKPLTHGGGAALASWLGAGLLILGIVLGAATTSFVVFCVLVGLAVQLWIVGMIIRPIEAIFTLIDERLPKIGS